MSLLLLPRWIQQTLHHRLIQSADVTDDIECSKLLHMPFVAKSILDTVYKMYSWLLLLVLAYVVSVCILVDKSQWLTLAPFRHSWWITSSLASLATALSMGAYSSESKSKIQIVLSILFSFILALYVVIGADLPATQSVIHPQKGLYLFPYLALCILYVVIAVIMWWLVFETQSFCSTWMQITSATQENLALVTNVLFLLSLVQLVLPMEWMQVEVDMDWYTGYFIYPMLLVTDTMAILNDKRKYITLSPLAYAIQIQLDLIHVTSHLSGWM